MVKNEGFAEKAKNADIARPMCFLEIKIWDLE